MAEEKLFIKLSDYINNISVYVLDCYYKVRSFIYENISKNSTYYFLLWKELRVLEGDKAYENFIEKKTGIHCVFDFKKLEAFEEWANNIIKKKEYAILITNQINEADSYYYHNWHHPHFMILNGYNPATQKYTLVDEDYSLNTVKQRWEHKSFVYINKEMSVHKLKTMFRDCISPKFLSVFQSNFTETVHDYLAALELFTHGNIDTEYFSFQKIDYPKDIHDQDPKVIQDEYIEYVISVLSSLSNIRELLQQSIEKVKMDIINNGELLILSDSGLIKPSIFEYQSTELGIHNFSLFSQMDVISPIAEKMNLKDLLDIMGSLKKKYKLIQNIFFKAIISQKPLLLDSISQGLDEILLEEKKLYIHVLEYMLSKKIILESLA